MSTFYLRFLNVVHIEHVWMQRFWQDKHPQTWTNDLANRNIKHQNSAKILSSMFSPYWINKGSREQRQRSRSGICTESTDAVLHPLDIKTNTAALLQIALTRYGRQRKKETEVHTKTYKEQTQFKNVGQLLTSRTIALASILLFRSHDSARLAAEPTQANARHETNTTPHLPIAKFDATNKLHPKIAAVKCTSNNKL